MWHESLRATDQSLFLEYREAIQRFACKFGTSTVRHWCLNGGLGLSVKLLREVSDYLEKTCGVTCKFDAVLVAECDSVMQKHLQDEIQPTLLVDKLHDEYAVENIVSAGGGSSDASILPPCDFMCCVGPPCQPVAVGAPKQAVKHWPDFFVVEHPLAAKGRTDQGAPEVVNAFSEGGYTCSTNELDPRLWGGPVVRPRTFTVGALDLRYREELDFADFFEKILFGMRMANLSPTKFLFEDEGALIATSNGLGLRCLTAEKVPLAGGRSDVDWKADHLRIAAEHGLVWPLGVDDTCSVGGLAPRERDLAVLCDQIWPATADGITFLDVSQNLPGIVASRVDENDKLDRANSPWNEVMTDTKCVVRTVTAGSVRIRVVELVEQLRMVGWCVETWRASGHEWRRDHSFVDQRSTALAELASTTSTIWHLGPLLCALIAAYGKYYVLEEDATTLGRNEAHNNMEDTPNASSESESEPDESLPSD